jgi:hypothetical protein
MLELGKLPCDARRWRAGAALLCSSFGLGCATADAPTRAFEPSADTVLASVTSLLRKRPRRWCPTAACGHGW